jgi:LmbE family N-acetylglucosaminyl deacetylase
MLKLEFGSKTPGDLRLLCLGAHSDDLEIGCAGALLQWIRRHESVEVTWVVLCAGGIRGAEADGSARALLRDAKRVDIVLADFPDGYLPADYGRVKAFFADLQGRVEPDVILTHRLEDRHQDHRLVSELTWQTWRDHLILEYEIPKYEGDLGQPSLFVPLERSVADRKVQHLLKHFGTQRSKSWFTPETFLGLMRLRGIECRASSGMAEAFNLRKATI